MLIDPLILEIQNVIFLPFSYFRSCITPLIPLKSLIESLFYISILELYSILVSLLKLLYTQQIIFWWINLLLMYESIRDKYEWLCNVEYWSWQLEYAYTNSHHLVKEIIKQWTGSNMIRRGSKPLIPPLLYHCDRSNSLLPDQ